MEGFLTSFSLNQLAPSVQQAANNGSFNLLRTYESGGDKHLLFRLVPGKGFNYYDFTLQRIDNTIKASDVLFYISGENLSNTIASLIETVGANLSNMDDINNFRNIVIQMKSLQAKKDWAGIKSLFDRISDGFRHDKTLEIFNILACQHIDNVSYKKALEDYAHDFPDATNACLLMIDMYFLNHEYERSLESINKLDSVTGGDPLLDYFRGNVFFAMEQKDSAVNCYLRAFAYDPSSRNTVESLVIYYFNIGQKEKARNILEQYEKTTGPKQSFIDGLYALLPGLKL
jgi:tetratricopeptide (TPR) repeat protein